MKVGDKVHLRANLFVKDSANAKLNGKEGIVTSFVTLRKGHRHYTVQVKDTAVFALHVADLEQPLFLDVE